MNKTKKSLGLLVTLILISIIVLNTIDVIGERAENTPVYGVEYEWISEKKMNGIKGGTTTFIIQVKNNNNELKEIKVFACIPAQPTHQLWGVDVSFSQVPFSGKEPQYEFHDDYLFFDIKANSNQNVYIHVRTDINPTDKIVNVKITIDVNIRGGYGQGDEFVEVGMEWARIVFQDVSSPNNPYPDARKLPNSIGPNEEIEHPVYVLGTSNGPRSTKVTYDTSLKDKYGNDIDDSGWGVQLEESGKGILDKLFNQSFLEPLELILTINSPSPGHAPPGAELIITIMTTIFNLTTRGETRETNTLILKTKTSDEFTGENAYGPLSGLIGGGSSSMILMLIIMIVIIVILYFSFKTKKQKRGRTQSK